MNVLRLLYRTVYARWQRYKLEKAWEYQYKRCREELITTSVPPTTLEDFSFKKVLILCPHADDEWIGCSSIIASGKYKVDVLYYQLYGYNKTEENKRVRDAEIAQCAVDHGFTLLTTERITETLRELVMSRQYDAVFVPSPIDWHWEHRFVFNTIAEIVLDLDTEISTQIFLYFISVPNNHENGVCISYLDKDMQHHKWDYFDKNYVSQKMPDKRYMLQEQLNVTDGTHHAAEVFQLLNKQQIECLSRFIGKTENTVRLDSLKNEINDIFRIRMYSKQIYHE